VNRNRAFSLLVLSAVDHLLVNLLRRFYLSMDLVLGLLVRKSIALLNCVP